MFKKLSITAKLMLFVGIIVTVMMSISMVISTRISFNTIYKRILDNEAPVSVNFIAETFESQISRAVSMSKLVADSLHLHSWLKKGEPEDSKPEAINLLKNVKKQGVDFVFMITAGKKNIIQTKAFLKS